MKERILKFFGMMPKLKKNIPERFDDELQVIFWMFVSWILLVCFCFFSLGCLIYDIAGASELNLFQRSGALVVASSAFVEIQFSKNPSWFDQDMLHLQHDYESSADKHFCMSETMQKMGWFCLILGTVIWAYGDFLVAMLTDFFLP